MKRVISVLLLSFLLYCGCTKENKSEVDNQWITENYPTTYHQIPSNTLDSLKKKYLKDKDSCFQTTLSEYGFCTSSPNYNFNCNQCCLALNQNKAHDLALIFLEKNKLYAGISDTSATKIKSYYAFGKSYLCTSDSSTWNIVIGNQVYSGLEVVNTGIYLRLNFYGVTEATGNWYPVITIPKKEAYSYDMAKSSLLGKQFDFMCWTMIHFKIDKDTKWVEPAQRKIVYPVSKNYTIELHVVWVLETTGFSFYIDVMTGEVIASMMNFVC